MTAKTSEKLDGDFLTVKERIDRKDNPQMNAERIIRQDNRMVWERV